MLRKNSPGKARSVRARFQSCRWRQKSGWASAPEGMRSQSTKKRKGSGRIQQWTLPKPCSQNLFADEADLYCLDTYRFDTPRANFLTFFFFSPRGPVRFALGAAFLRAVRFSFLRSSLSSTLVVSATCNLFRCNLFRVSRISGRCLNRITGN
jgi:hypothetical protein